MPNDTGWRRRWQRFYDPGQPVWLTMLEAATSSSFLTIAVLMRVEHLPTDVYTNVGGTILCIGWIAGAVVHRRRIMLLFSGALIAFNLLGIGAHVLSPTSPRTASGPGHDVTPGVTRQP